MRERIIRLGFFSGQIGSVFHVLYAIQGLNMLMRWLIPEIGFLNGHPAQSRLHVEAQRLFGFTCVRGALMGIAMFVPSMIVFVTLQDFGYGRRSEMEHFVYVFICVCAIAKTLVLLANRETVRNRIREMIGELHIQICYECGYDLSGNVTGICSECGTHLK